ncbi:MAG: signal recognition particle-docking protein FtsY [Gammaproteobacteria bacterium]|nr:signal recognition particle-docking protein FtsY [Gammaproteobacteria bacterium]
MNDASSKDDRTNDDASSGRKRGLFARLRGALSRTSSSLVGGIVELFESSKTLDEAALEELEVLLISSDIGAAATEEILDGLRKQIKKSRITTVDEAIQALSEQMVALLQPVQAPLVFSHSGPGPFVLLAVGINGAGKTTTLGKIANQLRQDGKKVILAAGDTFRAAAVEQLKAWGARNDVPVVAQHTGADSASVIFDACEAARARGIDVVLADTAGRLHTQGGLMDELKKIRRVIGKFDATAPHETLLVLDASIGQNALIQAREFKSATEVTGLALTKLDGTAKGGVLFAVAKELALPVRYIGVGEGIDDLRPFEPGPFVRAILEKAA